jgi:hypothetical protein
MLLGLLLGPSAPDLFFASTALFALAMAWVGYGLWQQPARRAARATNPAMPEALVPAA